MNILAALFFPRDRWAQCNQPSAADRMARYSPRYSADMRGRENAGAAPPKVRVVDGRPVLLALPGKPNKIKVTVPAPLSPEPAKVGEEPNAHE